MDPDPGRSQGPSGSSSQHISYTKWIPATSWLESQLLFLTSGALLTCWSSTRGTPLLSVWYFLPVLNSQCPVVGWCVRTSEKIRLWPALGLFFRYSRVGQDGVEGGDVGESGNKVKPRCTCSAWQLVGERDREAALLLILIMCLLIYRRPHNTVNNDKHTPPGLH